ncbi:MAG: hypothetical protein MMC33_007379 [Icmadophila ericetorum]|nr:hypothetical protein [Icmadophila ericetorum]
MGYRLFEVFGQSLPLHALGLNACFFLAQILKPLFRTRWLKNPPRSGRFTTRQATSWSRLQFETAMSVRAGFTWLNDSDSKILMKVCRHRLASASEILKVMLKTKEDMRWNTLMKMEELLLRFDDPEAMSLVMMHLHQRMGRLPEEVAFTTLHAFAITVDKYKLLDAIRWPPAPWLRKLGASMNDDDLEEAYR